MNETQRRTRCLRGLLCLQILTILRILLSMVPMSLGNWFNISGMLLSVAASVCLLLIPGRCRTAGVLLAASVVAELLPDFILPRFFKVMDAAQIQTVSAVLSWAGILLAQLSAFFRCSGYGILAPSKRKAWYIFFAVQLVIAAAGLVSVPVLHEYFQSVLSDGRVWIITLYNIFSKLLSVGVQVAHMELLRRTARIVEQTA